MEPSSNLTAKDLPSESAPTCTPSAPSLVKKPSTVCMNCATSLLFPELWIGNLLAASTTFLCSVFFSDKTAFCAIFAKAINDTACNGAPQPSKVDL